MLDDPFELSRRGLLSGGVVVASAATALHGVPAEAQSTAPDLRDKPHLQEVTLPVNGERRRMAVDARMSLADVLRERLGLRSTT